MMDPEITDTERLDWLGVPHHNACQGREGAMVSAQYPGTKTRSWWGDTVREAVDKAIEAQTDKNRDVA